MCLCMRVFRAHVCVGVGLSKSMRSSSGFWLFTMFPLDRTWRGRRECASQCVSLRFGGGEVTFQGERKNLWMIPLCFPLGLEWLYLLEQHSSPAYHLSSSSKPLQPPPAPDVHLPTSLPPLLGLGLMVGVCGGGGRDCWRSVEVLALEQTCSGGSLL